MSELPFWFDWKAIRFPSGERTTRSIRSFSGNPFGSVTAFDLRSMILR